MSHELHYTSAPRGLKPGSRGFCTVACTAGLSPTLAERLEALSGYRQVFPPHHARTGDNPVAWSHLIVRVAGKPYHVVSRVAAAGLDYSDRSNKYAHHVAIDPAERPAGGPGWLLRQPGFLDTAWSGEPRVLPGARPTPRGERAPERCTAWQQATGDAGWAGVVAQAFLDDPKRPVYLVYEPGTDLLPLIDEALALLPPSRRWEVTFSTYFTSLPPETQCGWRGVLVDSAEARQAQRFPGALILDLSAPLGPAPTGPLTDAARTGILPAAPPEPALAPTAFPTHDSFAAPRDPDRYRPDSSPDDPATVRVVPDLPLDRRARKRSRDGSNRSSRRNWNLLIGVVFASLVLGVSSVAVWPRHQPHRGSDAVNPTSSATASANPNNSIKTAVKQDKTIAIQPDTKATPSSHSDVTPLPPSEETTNTVQAEKESELISTASEKHRPDQPSSMKEAGSERRVFRINFNETPTFHPPGDESQIASKSFWKIEAESDIRDCKVLGAEDSSYSAYQFKVETTQSGETEIISISRKSSGFEKVSDTKPVATLWTRGPVFAISVDEKLQIRDRAVWEAIRDLVVRLALADSRTADVLFRELPQQIPPIQLSQYIMTDFPNNDPPRGPAKYSLEFDKEDGLTSRSTRSVLINQAKLIDEKGAELNFTPKPDQTILLTTNIDGFELKLFVESPKTTREGSARLMLEVTPHPKKIKIAFDRNSELAKFVEVCSVITRHCDAQPIQWPLLRSEVESWIQRAIAIGRPQWAKWATDNKKYNPGDSQPYWDVNQLKQGMTDCAHEVETFLEKEKASETKARWQTVRELARSQLSVRLIREIGGEQFETFNIGGN